MRTICSVAVLLALLAFPPAGAESPDAPSKGEVTALAVDPLDPDVIYAAFRGAGLARSDDGGRSFHPLGLSVDNATVRILLVAPGSPADLVAVVGGEGLFHSGDRGATWRRVEGVQEALALELDAVLDGQLYAATPSAVLLSRDFARTWEPLAGSPAGVRALAAHPHEPEVIYAAAGDVVFRGEARPGEWKVLGNLGAVPEDGQRIRRTRVPEIRDLLFDPLDPGQIYAASSQGVWKSVDGGTTWRADGLEGESVSKLLFAEKGGLGLLALTGSGVFARPQPSAEWTQVADQEVIAVAVGETGARSFVLLGDRKGRVLGTAADGTARIQTLYPLPRRVDRAPVRIESPRKVERGPRLVLGDPYPGHPVTALAVDPFNPAVIYAGGLHGVFRSEDFGATWAWISRGLELTDVHSLAVDPERSWIVYAATHGAGLFRSTDRGASWHPLREGVHHGLLRAVSIDPVQPRLVHVAGSLGLWSTEDRGARWRQERAPGIGGDIRSLARNPSASQQLGLGDAHGIAIDWNTLASEPSNRLRPGRLLVTSLSSETREGRRAAWLETSLGIDRRALAVRSLAFGAEGELLAATAFGLSRRREPEPDWISYETSRYSSKLRRATLFGSTYAWGPRLLEANVAAVLVDPSNPEVVYAGTSEGLQRSEDGGANWQEVELPGPPAGVFSLAVGELPFGSALYAGLADGRVAARAFPGDGWKVSWPRPPSNPRPEGPLLEPRRLLPAPDAEVADRLKQTEGVLPKAASRRRAFFALERLVRSRGEDAEEARRALARTLGWIDRERRNHGEEPAVEARFSDGGRWLGTAYCFDDGVSHSEIRLFDLERLRHQSVGWHRQLAPTPSGGASAAWKPVHDPAMEPAHLHPSWILADPGDLLGWSPRDGFLLSRRDPGRVLVWSIAHALPGAGGPDRPRGPAARYVELAAPGEPVIAWSGDERWLALASRGEAESAVRLVALGDGEPGSALQTSLEVVLPPERVFLDFTRDERWLRVEVPVPRAPRVEIALWMPAEGRPELAFEKGEDSLWYQIGGPRLEGAATAGPAVFEDLAGSPDGRALAALRPAVEGEGRRLLLWQGSAPFTLLAAHSVEPGQGELRFSPNSRCLAVSRPGRRWPASGRAEDGSRCRSLWLTYEGVGASLEGRGRGIKPLSPPAEEPRPPGSPWSRGSLRVWRPLPGTGWNSVEIATGEASLVGQTPRMDWALARPDETEHRQLFQLWYLAGPEPLGALVRAGRYGPAWLHPDEHRPQSWSGGVPEPFPDPATLPFDLLHELACLVVDLDAARRDWKELLPGEPFRSSCKR